MRSIHKQWKDKRSGWTRRITWYQNQDGTDIRLNVEDLIAGYNRNIFVTDRDSAQAYWDQFKAGSHLNAVSA